MMEALWLPFSSTIFFNIAILLIFFKSDFGKSRLGGVFTIVFSQFRQGWTFNPKSLQFSILLSYETSRKDIS
jgi:hypothetical protein